VTDPEEVVFLKKERLPAPTLDDTTSNFPSASRSPMATFIGLAGVVKSTFALKEIVPLVPVFLKMERALLP